MDHAHPLPAETNRTKWEALAAGWRFTRHLLEMVVAMLVGMAALDLAVMALGAPPGDDTLLGGYAYMGLAMTVPMVAWMRRRGHPWADCREMSAAMLGPMFALVLPVALGVERYVPWLNVHTLMLPAHGAMIGGMVLLMLFRRDRYAHGAHCHGVAPASLGSHAAPATDPVCGMVVDPGTAAWTAEHRGRTYRFCSPACQQEFEEDPSRFLAADIVPSR
jgi:YHS domain-containing protein